MNCKKVEELLPLYVGRDLPETQATVVTAHIHVCIECARSAQEYRESHRLLHALEPPQFSEATFAAMRSRVLRKIEAEPNSVSLFEFISRPFDARLRWALSSAVLLAVCFFAYYFVAHQRSVRPPQLTKVVRKPIDTGNPVSISQSVPTSSSPGPGSPGKPTKEVAALPATLGTNSPNPRMTHKTPTKPHLPESDSTVSVPLRSGRSLPADPNNSALTTLISSDKILRLEIQTTDPNIRIIWFSHSQAAAGSPNETSKGL